MPRHRPLSVAVLLPLLAVGLAGCWGSTYADRLEETARWYGHLEELDRVLASPAWADGCVTYFRPPREFELQFEEGPSPEPVPLVPEFVGAFEGLRGVWRADVPIADVDDPAARAPAYLFVVDNFGLWTSNSDTKRISARSFKDRIGRAVAREFSLEGGNVEDWTELRLPRPGGYGSNRSFRTVEGTLPERIDGHEYELKAFAFVTGDVHGAAFYVIPTATSNKARLDAAIALSIDTLEPMKRTPQPGDRKPTTKPGDTPTNDGPSPDF